MYRLKTFSLMHLGLKCFRFQVVEQGNATQYNTVQYYCSESEVSGLRPKSKAREWSVSYTLCRHSLRAALCLRYVPVLWPWQVVESCWCPGHRAGHQTGSQKITSDLHLITGVIHVLRTPGKHRKLRLKVRGSGLWELSQSTPSTDYQGRSSVIPSGHSVNVFPPSPRQAKLAMSQRQEAKNKLTRWSHMIKESKIQLGAGTPQPPRLGRKATGWGLTAHLINPESCCPCSWEGFDAFVLPHFSPGPSRNCFIWKHPRSFWFWPN